MSELVPFTELPLHRESCDKTPGQEMRLAKHSGVYPCSLKTITPLCLNKHFERQQRTGKTATIPGSSIRGMVRNAAEMIGAGCGRFNIEAERKRNLRTCGKDDACVVCRIFGFVNRDYAWTSKVRFTDTIPVTVDWQEYPLTQARGGRGFTEDRPGWVLFEHRDPPEPCRKPARGPACVSAGVTFRFRVEYLNLSEEEYAVFWYALTLEHAGVQLCHKLGFGKSLGMGSCCLRVDTKGVPPISAGAIEYYLKQPGFEVIRRCRSIGHVR